MGERFMIGVEVMRSDAMTGDGTICSMDRHRPTLLLLLLLLLPRANSSTLLKMDGDFRLRQSASVDDAGG